MSLTSQVAAGPGTGTGTGTGTGSPAPPALRIRFEGAEYPGEPYAKGAACELFGAEPLPGFLANPRPGATLPYRRFVPACDAEVVAGPVPPRTDPALAVPLSRAVSWSDVHRLSQSHPAAGRDLIARVRATAEVRAGTR